MTKITEDICFSCLFDSTFSPDFATLIFLEESAFSRLILSDSGDVGAHSRGRVRTQDWSFSTFHSPDLEDWLRDEYVTQSSSSESVLGLLFEL